MGTTDFFNNAPNLLPATDPNFQGTPSDTTFVNAVYYVLTGAEPSASVLNSQLAALAAAGDTSAAYSNVAKGVTSSKQYRNHLTTLIFQNFLGHDPSSSDLSKWNTTLSQSTSGPNGMSRDEQLIDNLFSKQEYFMRQTDGNGLHTNQSWANSLFSNLQITGFYTPSALDTAESAIDTQVLNAYKSQRQAAAKLLLTSTAYRTLVITNAYMTYTGQPPTASQLSTWLTNFSKGQTRENLFQSLLSSQAFYQYAPQILGVAQIPTPTTFVEAAFTLLFPGFNYTNTDPSNPNDISYWTTRMQNGMTQSKVASGLLALPLYLSDPTTGLITRLFQQYIGRPATTTPNGGEIATWKNKLTHGSHDEDLIAFLLATADYFNQTHTFP